MPKTRQSCNNRWGWRFLLEFTEPRVLASFLKEHINRATTIRFEQKRTMLFLSKTQRLFWRLLRY